MSTRTHKMVSHHEDDFEEGATGGGVSIAIAIDQTGSLLLQQNKKN